MGWTWKIFAEAWMSLPLGFAVAFTIDSLVVGTPAKYLIKKE